MPLAFLSHFVVDYIPHFSFADRDLFKRGFNTLLILDILTCIGLVGLSYLLFPTNWLVISICMFLATSPDFMWMYYRLYLEKIKGVKHIEKRYDPVAAWHHHIQETSHNRFARRGIRNEVLWLLAMCTTIGLFL